MLDVILSNDTFKLMDKTLNYVADSISYRFPHHLEETSDDVRIELDNVPTLPISIKTTSILKAENSIIGKNGGSSYLNKKLDQQKSEITYISIILNEVNDLKYMHKYIIIYYYFEAKTINSIITKLNISKSLFYKYKKEALMILALCLPEICVFKGGEKNEL